MVMRKVVRSLLNAIDWLREWAAEEREDHSIYCEEPAQKELKLRSVWDYIKLVENTQAYHLCGVVGFEEWIEMEEIKRRILELFSGGYKNDRSLYPYVKTLVDCGLFETMSAGGRRKWRKRELLVPAEEVLSKASAASQRIEAASKNRKLRSA